jgi:hypothetical protein
VKKEQPSPEHRLPDDGHITCLHHSIFDPTVAEVLRSIYEAERRASAFARLTHAFGAPELADPCIWRHLTVLASSSAIWAARALELVEAAA